MAFLSPERIALIEGLFRRADQSIEKLSAEFFRPFLKKQKPQITLVTCSDSRVQTEVLGWETVNRAFVVRNIGNQILNNLGSVDYGVLHLRTPLLLIMGHVRCGAVESALGDFSKEAESIVKELNGLFIPVRRVLEKEFKRFEDLREETALENVHFQVEVALKRYASLVSEGTLTIVGAIYDFANLYGRGKGKLLLVNLNGKRSVGEILKELPEGEDKVRLEKLLKSRFVEKSWAKKE